MLQVRQMAQSVLFRCVSQSGQTFRALWPQLVEMLGKPDITHEQLKVGQGESTPLPFDSC